MADLNITKTLLIFLLALRELKTPLSEDELEAFKNSGYMLEMGSEYWEEDIQPALMAIVEGNEELNRLFQTIKKELESVEEIPPEILPTWEELEAELAYGDSEPVTFSVDTDPNPDITTTTVAVSTIFKSANPTELVQNISSVKRLTNYLYPLSPPLEKMTLRQLRQVLGESNISRYSRTRKAQLLEAIKQKEEAAKFEVSKVETRYINTAFHSLDSC